MSRRQPDSVEIERFVEPADRSEYSTHTVTGTQFTRHIPQMSAWSTLDVPMIIWPVGLTTNKTIRMRARTANKTKPKLLHHKLKTPRFLGFAGRTTRARTPQLTCPRCVSNSVGLTVVYYIPTCSRCEHSQKKRYEGLTYDMFSKNTLSSNIY